MTPRRLEIEIVGDFSEFNRGMAVAQRRIANLRTSNYAGAGFSTPEFERMLARLKALFGRRK